MYFSSFSGMKFIEKIICRKGIIQNILILRIYRSRKQRTRFESKSETAMVRNLYSQIPYPSLKIK